MADILRNAKNHPQTCPGPGKSMTRDLTHYVLDAFKTHCNAPDLRAESSVLPGELYIIIRAAQPTAAMHQLARALESEFDELDQRVSISVQRPASGLWGRLAHWSRHRLGFR